MFWILAGAALAVLLLGAWIYDRRSASLALTDRDRKAFTRNSHDQAHADASVTQLGQWNGPL